MSAAWAVEAEFKRRGHDVQTVDVLDHTGKGFRRWYRGGYEVLVKKRPKVWGHLYRTSDKKRFNYWFQTGLDLTFVSRMRRFISKERPDWIVCTHSLPQPVLAAWRERQGFRVAVVVTDLYPQLMWLRGNPDWYFVPGDWSQQILEKRMPRAKGRTTVTGIPIDHRFGDRVSKSEARQSLGLQPDRTTVLVTSGGIGGGPIGDVVRGLVGFEDIQSVIICGRSEAAYHSACSAAGGVAFVTVKGLVDTAEMAMLMKAADVIVAKPGGITTFEALASGLPFFVFDPFLIPGQEEKNAEFLVENGIGIRVSSAGELVHHLKMLIETPERLADMSSNAFKCAKPDAAERIVSKIEEESRERPGD